MVLITNTALEYSIVHSRLLIMYFPILTVIISIEKTLPTKMFFNIICNLGTEFSQWCKIIKYQNGTKTIANIILNVTATILQMSSSFSFDPFLNFAGSSKGNKITAQNIPTYILLSQGPSTPTLQSGARPLPIQNQVAEVVCEHAHA